MAYRKVQAKGRQENKLTDCTRVESSGALVVFTQRKCRTLPAASKTVLSLRNLYLYIVNAAASVAFKARSSAIVLMHGKAFSKGKFLRLWLSFGSSG